MLKNSDETTVTYFNKGQTYSISVTNMESMSPSAPSSTYRTTVFVTFDDEQRRRMPGVCWERWKQLRGTDEAHHINGQFQAAQFVGLPKSKSTDITGSCTLELESAFVDGFSVLWSSPQAHIPTCDIAVRFNFLSTDFNQSCGMKGIPLHLCVRTTVLSTQSLNAPNPSNPEVSYCKIKVFRDHGAERKLAHDVHHVKKAIIKLNQRIAHAETEKELSKARRRMKSRSHSSTDSEPPKLPRPRLSTATGLISNRALSAEALRLNLSSLQSMFTSTIQNSVLNIKGDVLDVPYSELRPSIGRQWVSTDLETVDEEDMQSTDSSLATLRPLSASSAYADSSHGYDEVQTTSSQPTTVISLKKRENKNGKSAHIPIGLSTFADRHHPNERRYKNLSESMETSQIGSCRHTDRDVIAKPSTFFVERMHF